MTVKKFLTRLKVILVPLIGIAVLASIWQFSKPYTYAVPFIQIPLGQGRHELSTCPINYLAVQQLHTVGIVSFDEKLNVCISDGHKKLFFNQQRKLRKVQFSRELESLIALSHDGSLWSATYLTYPPNSPYDRAIFASDCIRKYDSQGKLIFQFGEPEPRSWLKKIKLARYRRALSYLKKKYHHLFGKSYQFGSSQIFGLWVDYKGRLYILTEYPSLHIFDTNGKSLLVFNFESDITFKGERRDMDGVVNFVDMGGRIYTRVLEFIGRFKILRFRWKGWKEFPWEWDEQEVYKGWIEVWEWEPEVRKVQRMPTIGNGCIVGVDKWKNVYWSLGKERIYRIEPDGKIKKVFEPRRFYRKEMINEWEKVFEREPNRRSNLETARWQYIARMERWEPRPIRLIRLYSRDLYEYAIEHGNGPRVGHIAYVDKDGNLYITLVTATHFRIDKIERASRWEKWWSKIWKRR